MHELKIISTIMPDILFDYDYWLYVVSDNNTGGWLYCDDYRQLDEYIENRILYD